MAGLRPLPLPDASPEPTPAPVRPLPIPEPDPAPQVPRSTHPIGVGRLDPYYDGVWTSDVRGVLWATRKRTDRLIAAGLAKWIPRHLSITFEQAVARLGWAWEVKLAYLGALQTWRTLTAEQLTAITGFDAAARTGRTVLAELYALGALQAGFAWSPSRAPGRNTPATTVYRIADSTVLRRHFDPMLTYAEWISITGGTRWSAGAADRHDLLAAELAIRLTERPGMLDSIATVLGERFSSLHDLAFHGPGFDVPPQVTDRAADMVIVRADGLRIVVELQARNTRALDAKLHGWARAMEAHSVDETGVVVLVLLAPGPDDLGDAKQIRHAVSRAVRARPGTLRNRTADRFLVAEWTDWFPAAREASAAFGRLAAKRLNLAASMADNVWEDVDLLAGSALTSPSRLVEPLAVATNAAGLRGTPIALRREGQSRPDLSGVPVARTGLDGVLEELAASRRRPLLAVPRTPARLRF